MKNKTEILTLPCGTNLEENIDWHLIEIYDENDLYMGEIDKDFIELFDELLEKHIANLGKGQCMQWNETNGWQEIHYKWMAVNTFKH